MVSILSSLSCVVRLRNHWKNYQTIRMQEDQPESGCKYNGRVNTADVIIAGGGIIGLSTALELALKGLRVTVLERGQAMSEASWAAAGMLAAGDPENPPQLRPLSDLSIALYPAYLNTVERLSGLRVPVRTTKTLHGSELGSRFPGALSADEIAACVPELVSGNRSFLCFDEQSIDPRDLCAALPGAAIAAGVTLIEQSPVTSVHSNSSGVEIVTSEASYSGSHFVNCCGAWAGTLAGFSGIEPRKGQMAAVKLRAGHHLDCVIHTPEIYLVPRGDGRVIVGASVEQAGFDKSVEDTTIQALIEEAAAVWPPIGEGEIVETWAGLRPGSRDALPLLDACGQKHCWIATGHFRNGILLAPGTAHVLRQLICQETPAIELAPFRCDRFAAAYVS
jgi:glycine oxidase